MPGVVIISEAERLSKVIDGATFYYRRVPAHIRNNMMTTCTSKRGNIDWGRYGAMLMEYGLLGWADVIDQTGAPVTFTKEIIGYLPDRIQGEMIELLGENTEQLAGELKNLPPTPSSNL